MSTFCYTIKSYKIPTNLKKVQIRDTVWMILSTLKDKIPMWAAWNSLLTVYPLLQQPICYLQNISLPPTHNDVVCETMRIAQRVAAECNEKYVVVTYNLGIAKPASQIQAQESSQFDNVFIMFGTFHIQMAYFDCIGFFIDGNGGETIMLYYEVLTPGSLNGFISARHSNKDKRLHPILALAFSQAALQMFH